MTSRAQIEQVIGALYEARLREDAEATIRDFADDGVFTMNAKGTGAPGAGEPVVGKPALKTALAQLIATWKFDDWQKISLMVDGEKALLHWRARVTCAQTGKGEVFDCFDVITFRDGKIVDYRQATDTALMMRLAS
ncbi:hypothetical protein BH10PSE6_BH10PSE6_50770 [soil metagenome]